MPGPLKGVLWVHTWKEFVLGGWLGRVVGGTYPSTIMLVVTTPPPPPHRVLEWRDRANKVRQPNHRDSLSHQQPGGRTVRSSCGHDVWSGHGARVLTLPSLRVSCALCQSPSCEQDADDVLTRSQRRHVPFYAPFVHSAALGSARLAIQKRSAPPTSTSLCPARQSTLQTSKPSPSPTTRTRMSI